MTFRLFLDDVRNPTDVGLVNDEWIIARSYRQAVDLVQRLGFPDQVSFDHDLGEVYPGVVGPTGKHFANWLVEQDMNSYPKKMPAHFAFTVHSANEIGRKAILSYVTQYMEQRFGKNPESIDVEIKVD